MEELREENGQGNSPLIKSHVSISDCDERSLYIIESTPREQANHLKGSSGI